MRLILNLMPMILLVVNQPAFGAQPEAPTPSSPHRIQVYRIGKGESRIRNAEAARTAAPRITAQVQDKGRTHAYQAAKPGEGAPKR